MQEDDLSHFQILLDSDQLTITATIKAAMTKIKAIISEQFRTLLEMFLF